jgi:ferredoxin
MCVSVAERFFELRDGYATPVEPETDPDEDVVEAAESCPLEAIKVHAVADGRLIAPQPY